jgi:acyl carrier protein
LLGVSAAFHTQLVAHAQKPFAKAIETVTFNQPQIPVYSNLTAKPYPSNPQQIQNILKEHLMNQVLFQEEIENIYAEGGDCFIEFGPRKVLTNLVKEILSDRPHIAVALNGNSTKDSDRTLKEAVIQLRVAGLALQNIDSYQLESKTPEVTTNKVLNVRLNSTNYVSAKTKQAFEKALEQEVLAKSPVNNGLAQAANYSSQNQVLVNNGVKMASSENGQGEKLLVQPLSSTTDYQKIIDSLEYTLIEFNRHQRSVLQVHEQSLQHQIEYTKTFFHLMQQQQALWGNGKFTQEQAQTQQLAISSSERSMMRFHDHQAESLRIHEQYLNYQQEYTNQFFQLINHNILVSPLDTPAIPSPYSAVEQHPVLVTKASTAVVSNGVITQAQPLSNGLSNGNGNGVNHQPEAVLEMITPIENHSITTTVAVPSPIAIDTALLSQTLLNVVSDKTGYPVEMLDLSMDMEADLGIDSIKRVEILGGLLELHPDLPQLNPEELGQLRTLGQIVEYMATLVPGVAVDQVDVAVISDLSSPHPEVEVTSEAASSPYPEVEVTSSPSAIDLANLSPTLLNIVSDKTGYPTEMLDMSMDIEADLGIDSIKRVEILGALLELYPELPKPNPEELGQLRTLGEIVAYIEQQVAGAEKKMLLLETQQNTSSPPQSPEIKELPSLIHRHPVKLKFLPEPDVLECALPEQHIVLLTDDGSLTTGKLAEALCQRGWKTVVLTFPQTVMDKLSPLPTGINRVVLTDWSEEHLQKQLDAIASNYGQIGGFIHLNPANHTQISGVHYLESEKTLLRHIFLIAKHLKQPLNQAALLGRSCFLTITRLDGELGFKQNTNFGAISGGLFGLTKTINQEWESVFCRAIDISPDLDEQTSVNHILAELYDPNRLIVEVGYSAQGRVTLVC